MSTTVFRNGSLFDGHRYAGAGAAVVRDGRIAGVHLGEDAGRLAEDQAGPGARVVDLAGGLLAPGFVDAHVHPVQGGLERTRCDLSEGETREDYLALIKAYADAHPDRPWILGGGWAMAAFPGGTPTAADLDRVVPDRPAFLPNRDHHGGWANSRALELAGIDASTPDPADGRIERDADGRPTGTLHEGAMALVAVLAPDVGAEDYRRGLLEGQRYLHSLGVTGWQDAIVGGYAGMQDPGQTYREAAAAGELTSYVVGALWWEREQGLEQIASLVERRRGVRARPVPADQHQDHAGRRGRELHGRDDRSLPRPVRPCHRQRRPLVRRPGRPEGVRRRAVGRGLPGPRALHRRPECARGAGRVRARPGRDGAARPQRTPTSGTTSLTCRSSTPTTSPGSPSSAWPRTCRPSGRSTNPR